VRELKPEIKCDKCGKLQERDKDKSNKNWSSYTTGKKCECGGEFKLSIDGHTV